MPTLSYNEGMDFGLGYDGLTGEQMLSAVNPGPIDTEVEGAEGLIVSSKIIRIDSFESLQTQLGINVSVNAQFGLFGADAKMNYSESTDFNTEATFLVVHCIVKKEFHQILHPTLTDEARSLLADGKEERFRERFGDHFISGILSGGEFYGVAQVSSSNLETQEKFTSTVQAQYGAFLEGDVDYSEQLKALSKEVFVDVTTYQVGGDDNSMVTGIDEIISRAKSFPGQVKGKFAKPYLVMLKSYKTLDLPEGPRLVDIEHQKDVLNEIARVRRDVLTSKNTVRYVLMHQEYYDNPDIEDLNETNRRLGEILDRLHAYASRCARSQSECEFPSFEMPTISLPARKGGVETPGGEHDERPPFDQLTGSQLVGIGVRGAHELSFDTGQERGGSLHNGPESNSLVEWLQILEGRDEAIE